jgi:hemerythrin
MIEWDDKYSVGISEIDEQHKELINIINKAIVLIINKTIDIVQFGTNPQEILELLDEMTEFAKEHFATEEAYMIRFHFLEYQLHKEEHFNFSNKTISYRNQVMGGDTKIACEILEYLKRWLVEHIQVTDRKYIDCFKENGLK